MPQRIRKRETQQRGQRWVDENYDIKKDLKDNNGGVMPETPAFSTSEFEGSDQWSEQNLPDILFYLQPPKSRFEDREPQPVLDIDGEVVMSPAQENRALRNIPALPDRISLDVPAWMVMAWRRIDSRITLQDIIDRMTTDLGEAQKLTEKTAAIPNKNCLQNNCMRNCRKLLSYYNDYGRRVEPHRAEVEAMEALTTNNLRYNTILQYDPVFHRLIKVQLVRGSEGGKFSVQQMNVTKENMLETTYPVDYFLFDDYVPDPSTSMIEAVTVLWMLQERAIKHGLDPSCWKKLDKTCLPSTWFDRTKKDSHPNESPEDKCETCERGLEETEWFNCGQDEWMPYAEQQNGESEFQSGSDQIGIMFGDSNEGSSSQNCSLEELEIRLQASLEKFAAEQELASGLTEPYQAELPQSMGSGYCYGSSFEDDPMLFSDMADPSWLESSVAALSNYSQAWPTSLDQGLPFDAPAMGIG